MEWKQDTARRAGDWKTSIGFDRAVSSTSRSGTRCPDLPSIFPFSGISLHRESSSLDRASFVHAHVKTLFPIPADGDRR